MRTELFEDTELLERELGAIEELVLGTELEVVAMLELLGANELVVATEELLGAIEERELGATELLGAIEERELELGARLLKEPPTIFVHVERAIQLLLFSQPQPLWVVAHSG
jgi:hypothetical protein